MTTPLISAICPTYGRAPRSLSLLQEAVYWFTRQTYANRELIILNDAFQQTLYCHVPGVRVINVKERYPTLGEKYDALVRLANGSIIMPWEDDDISLPHRMEQAAKKLESADYFNPQHTWYEQSGELHHEHQHGYCHNASAYRRNVWVSINGYGATTGNQDAVFEQKVTLRDIRLAGPIVDKNEWSYVYRWGVSPLHLSGHVDMVAAYRSAPASQCVAYIVPEMGRDYHSDTQQLLFAINNAPKGCPCQNPCS